MSATITWSIQWMQCKVQEGQYSDVVITAGWCCAGLQTADSQNYEVNVCNIASFPQPTEGGSFTPYDQLTQEQVLGWVWANGVDKDAVEANVQKQLADKINPPIVQPPLPWLPPTPAA